MLETIEPRDRRRGRRGVARRGPRRRSKRAPSIVNSTVRGPAIIGARTRVVDSYVGPFTSIAADCEIVDSEIEHSVVLERSRIVGVPRLADSLIGREVEVVRSGETPVATRLMVGDHSRVELAE